MLNSLVVREKLFRIAENVHLRIFGHEMGDQMRKFLRNLSWSFLGGLGASALMLGVNVLVGRYFGPEEYGKYNIVLILSQFLLVFLYLGIDVSSVKFISSEKYFGAKKIFFSTSFYFVSGMIFLSWALYYVTQSWIEQHLGINGQYLKLALILGSALALKGMVDGYLRSYSLFRFQAVLRIVEATLVISLLSVTLWVVGIKEYQYYIYVLSCGAGVFFLATLFRLRNNFNIFQWESLKSMLSYGGVILAGTILGIFFNSLDKIIVAKYLGVTQLGIYSAYFITATNLIAQMTQIFNNVFFPAASQSVETAYIEKIDILMKWFFIPGGLFLSLVLYGVVFVFGDAYEPSILLAMGFGFLAVLQIFLTVNASIIMALSKALLKRYYLWLYAVSFFHVVLYVVLVYLKLITIPILLLLFFINFTVVIFIQKSLIGEYVQESR